MKNTDTWEKQKDEQGTKGPFPLALPQLTREAIELASGQWQLIYYREDAPLLRQDATGELFADVLPALQELVKQLGPKQDQSFYTQLSLRTVPLLAGVFATEREIRLASPRLHRELLILNSLQEQKGPFTQGEQDFMTNLGKWSQLDPNRFPSVWERKTWQYDLPDLGEGLPAAALEEWQHLSEKVLQGVRDYRPSLFERMTDFGLNLTALYALLRIHLLKFLAVLPSLDHDREGKEVKRIFLEMCRRLLDDSAIAKVNGWKGERRPLPEKYLAMCRLIQGVASKMGAKLLSRMIRRSVRLMAKRFIAGTSIHGSTEALRALRASHREATLDQLGELVVSEKEADQYTEKVLSLIQGLRQHVKKGEKNRAGIPCAHVSIKMSALSADFNPLAIERTYQGVYPRLKKILLAAKVEEVFIHVDAEHFHHRHLIFTIFKRALLETPELEAYPWIGIVLQGYLQDAYTHFQEILELARERRTRMPIRLVKGAYWDAETIEASVHAFNSPQFLNKEETDLHFRQLIQRTLLHGEHLQLCLGSHNLSDHCYAEAVRTHLYPGAPVIEHQCLHMTYEALGMAMVKMNWPVRNYIPIGDLLVGMAYLVRRIMENSSQVGILSMMRMDKKKRSFPPPEKILAEKKKAGRLSRGPTEAPPSADFFNMVPVRGYLREEGPLLHQSVEDFGKNKLGAFYQNSFALSGKKVAIMCPSDEKLMVGEIQWATSADAQKALDLLHQGTQERGVGNWREAAPLARSSVLLRAAQLMLVQRLELAALMVWEGGKAIKEALADVDEAIDFANFYAREELRLMKGSPELLSLGVVAVISPWNFPLAIPCGMVTAALVAGNSVILKSSEQTPLVAQRLVDLLHAAGVPKNVLIHLPGQGEEVGALLVESPLVNGIVFTGSRAVGVQIAHKAAQRIFHDPAYSFHGQVRCITEMGGKNAVIVTANAELDETIQGLLQSAFLHAGQKCSALSRILVDATIRDRFLPRFQEAVLDLKVGRASDFATFVNPLIAPEEKTRLRQQVKEAVAEAKRLGGKIWVDLSQADFPGNCLGPVVIELPWKAVLAEKTWANTELFGPVVHVISYPDLKTAVRLFNGTEYALTGGIFSQSQDDVDELLRQLEAGNLYVNRTCTGARVAIEPFGGFKLSGTGPKAGGTSYVQAFHFDPFHRPVEGKGKERDIKVSSNQNNKDEMVLLSSGDALWRGRDFDRSMKAVWEWASRWPFYAQAGTASKDQAKMTLEFLDWLRTHGRDYIQKKHPNRTIPGQLSYNDHFQRKHRGCFLSWHEGLDSPLILDALAALVLGCGVTFLVAQEKCHQHLSTLLGLLSSHGIGTDKVSLFHLPELERVGKLLADNEVEFLILDGPLEVVREVLPPFTKSGPRENCVRSIHSLLDGRARGPLHFQDILLSLLKVRSMSINTMRHGAPLAIQENDHE